MNLEKLYEFQRMLDNGMQDRLDVQGKPLLTQKLLALQVKIGELANETQCFKFWMPKKSPARRRILDSYVDCLYLIFSIGIEKGFDETFRKAIMSHASYTGIPRDTLLSKVLFACDELAGFITAVAYVRPSRSVDEVEVKSVKKKMKDKAFARAVSREDIISGSEQLGVSLDEHIQFCIKAMQANKAELGL
jgi:hypothetical protein